MSSRAQAALRNLQLRLLETLPFLEALQAPREVLEILLDDFHKNQTVETTQKAVDTQVGKDKKQGYSTGESEATFILREDLKRVRKESLEAEEAAEKAIDKHYRVTSRTLHPDRSGEESRPAFERLTKARDCLRLTDKRRLYIEQLMQVSQISPSLVEKSHEAWVARNMPDAEPMPTTKKPSATGGAALMIKGGIANDIPRKAYVSILNLKKRRVQIEMPTKASFCDYCVKMYVVASCADYEKDEVNIATVGKEAIEAARDAMERDGSTVREISVDAVLPVSGIWDITWYATLLINGQKVKTPNSHEARVDLTSEEQRRRRAAIASTDELAKQRAGDIQSILRKLRGPRPDHLEIERRCDLLHEVVARGRSTLNRLLDLLRADGADESTVTGIHPLREALELAGPAKTQLEAQFQLSSKKDSLKSFKHHVASLLESGEAAAWLRTVEDEDLVSLGGETNRLYQLLVEGRVAHHLELDAATLEAAVNRNDLFTPKQCETLTARKIEAEEQVEKEAERAMVKAKEKREQEKKEAIELAQMRKKQAEEEKKKKLLQARYEAEREAHLAAIRESEEMAKGMVAEHLAHSLVEIKGLKTKDGVKLNGTIGTVMHKKGDRYVVQSQIDNKLRSFNPLNLHNLGVMAKEYASPMSSHGWSCDICTFLHDGDRAHATRCEMCNNPRENKNPSSYSASASNKVPVQAKRQVLVSNPKAATPEHKAAKGSPAQKSQPCFHGANCRFIKNGCKFYHSPEEIAKAQSAAKGNVEQTMYIPDVAVGWVIGKGGGHMKKVQNTTHCKVSVNQKTMYPNQTRIVTFSGSQKSVDTALQMVKDLVAEYDIGHGVGPPAAKRSPEANGIAPRVASVPKSVPARQAPKPPSPPQPIQPPKAAQTAVSPPKTAYLAPPSLVQEPARKSAAAKPRPVTPSPTSSDRLEPFLREQKGCLKGSPKAFGQWLQSEDIVSLEDLAAAVADDDYLHEVLQHGDGKVGVKGFKRVAFKKAVLAAVSQSVNGMHSNVGRNLVNDDEAPAELMCPISHVLMSNDPVIAADGHTYERAAIDAWFRKQSAEIATAKQQIASGSDSQQARAIIDRGVLSPMTHAKMSHLNLTPNHNVRNLARDFARGSR